MFTFQTNELFINSSQNDVTLNANSSIVFDSFHSNISIFDRVKYALLYLRVNPPVNNNKTEYFVLYYVKNNEETFIDVSQTTSINNYTYIFFDVTEVYRKHRDESITFKIYNNTSNLHITISLTSSFIKYSIANPFEYINNQKLINNSVGSSLNFSQDVINSFYYISKPIFNNIYDIQYALTHDAYHPHPSDNDDKFLFFPKGWKLNILERIYLETISNDEYYNVLIDSSFNYHRFKPVYQNNIFMDCYIDTSGTSLLMQRVTLIDYPSNNNLGYKVFSPISCSYKIYDPDGFLIKIAHDNGTYTSISYSSASIVVTEPKGNTITITNCGSYNTNYNSILISSSVVSLTYRLLVSKTNKTLYQIIYNSHVEEESFSPFIHTYLTNTDTITYNSDFSISSILTFDNYSLDISIGPVFSTISIKKNDYDLINYQFERYWNTVIFTNTLKDIEIIYYFDDKGEIQIEKENDGDYKNIINHIVYGEMNKYNLSINSIKRGISFSFPTTEFNVNYQNPGTPNDIISSNLYVSAEQTYLLVVVIEQVHYYPSEFNENRSTKVYLANNYPNGDPIFKFNNNGLECKSSLIYVSGNNVQLVFRFNNNFGRVVIKKAYLVPILDVDSATLFQSNNDELFKTINGENFSKVNTICFDYDGNTHELTNSDIKINLLSHYKGDSTSYFFTDDLTNVFIDISNPNVLINNSNNTLSFYNQIFMFYKRKYSIEEASKITYSPNNNYKIQSYIISDNQLYSPYIIYDYHGNVLEKRSYKGTKEINNYDSRLNLTCHRLITNNNSLSIIEDYIPDPLNRVLTLSCKVANQDVSRTFSYIDLTSIISAESDPYNSLTTYLYSVNYEYITQKSKSSYKIGTSLNKNMMVTGKTSYSDYPKYTYSYDAMGRLSDVYYSNPGDINGGQMNRPIIIPDGDTLLLNITYLDLDNHGERIIYHYANSMNNYFFYDKYQRITQTKTTGCNDGHITYFTYDEDNKMISSIEEHFLNNVTRTTTYTYNQYYNDVENISVVDDENYAVSRDYSYDTNRYLHEEEESVNGSSVAIVNGSIVTTTYTRDNINQEILSIENHISMTSLRSIDEDYYVSEAKTMDGLGRLSSIVISSGNLTLLSYVMSYYQSNSVSSNQVTSITYSHNNTSVSYGYDKKGNITSSNYNLSNQITYTYDDNNQLLSENHIDELYSIIYTYDYFGNITSVTRRNSNNVVIESHSYSYSLGNPNRLETFDNNSISYDALNNPTSLNGATLSYTRVNMLSSYVKGNTTAAYEYNYEGIRTKKVVNTITHHYILNGHNISREIIENSVSPYTKSQIIYLYGINGVYGFTYGVALYLYEKDIFNNVNRIYRLNSDNSLTLMAMYHYIDAYGNHEVLNANGTIDNYPTSIGHINPFRYRSYYYDEESGYYYCNHRYYVPLIRRWLTMDDLSYLDSSSINGINLYAYCKNNPNAISFCCKQKKDINFSSQNISFILENNKNDFENYSRWFNISFSLLPSFSADSIELSSLEMSIFEQGLMFDRSQKEMARNYFGKLEAYLGYNIKKEKAGILLDASIVSLSYETKYYSITIDFFTLKFCFGIFNGKPKFDPGFGVIDFGLSINFIEIIKELIKVLKGG